MKSISIGFIFILCVFAMSGCTTVDDGQSLNQQAVSLNTEVTRLNQELYQKDMMLQQEIQKSAELEQKLQAYTVGTPGQYGGYPAEVEKKPLSDISSDKFQTITGFEVKAKDIQLALKNAGYYKGAIDGKLGPESRMAMRAFQKDNKMETDGVCGPKTWQQLKLFLDKQGG